MPAHRKSDRRRADLCEGGHRKRELNAQAVGCIAWLGDFVNCMKSSFCHLLKQSLDVGAAIAELNQRRDSRVRDCVHWQAIKKLVELLW